MKLQLALCAGSLVVLVFLTGHDATGSPFFIRLFTYGLAAASAAVLFTLMSRTLQRKPAKQLRPGNSYFDTVWNSVVLAVTSIFLALSVDTALKSAGLQFPFSMLILTPLSSLLILGIAMLSKSKDNPRQLRAQQNTPAWKSAAVAILIGLAAAVTSHLAVSAIDHILNKPTVIQGEQHGLRLE